MMKKKTSDPPSAELEDEITPRGGRPTKYDPEYHPTLIAAMCRKGATNKQVCTEIGIVVDTLWHWQQRYPEVKKALEQGKAIADARVESSLYMLTNGFRYTEQKTVTFSDGSQKVEVTEKYVPPDRAACESWLNNRKPEDWRSTRRIEATGANGEPLFGAGIFAGRSDAEIAELTRRLLAETDQG